MGTSYQASINVQCLKEHTCVACEGKYSYLLTRDIKSQGGTQHKALENAQKMAMKSMANDVDFHPCPNCGIVQPEMTADVKSRRIALGTAIGLIIMVVALIMGLATGVRIAGSAYIGLVGAGFAMLMFAFAAFYNPNRNLQLNVSRAQQSIDSKQMIVTEMKQVGSVNDQFGGLKSGNLVGFVLGGLMLLSLAAPILLPSVNGWYLNDSIYPAVAGPGDQPTFYFGKTLKSLQGYWNGSASAKLINANELGTQGTDITAKTKSSTWGNTISGKSVSNKSNTMWAQVSLPREMSDVNGKTGQFDLVVRARFPYKAGNEFVINNSTFQHSAEVTFSAAGAGSSYYSSWLFGQLGALVLLVFSCIFHSGVSRWLRRQGNPTEVTTLGEASDLVEGEEPPQEEA